MKTEKAFVIGVDTSNYTTSLSAVDSFGNPIANIKYPLRVAEGGRGLRQSDAVFEHTRNLPLAMEQLKNTVDLSQVAAIGYSEKPRNAEGAYMPCFLSGIAAAKCFAAASGACEFAFSHQDGHIRAACHSAGFKIEAGKPFAAFHISGGTTELLLVEPTQEGLSVRLIGETKDLNAGQLVDRIGVHMGMKFPCGAEMDALALENQKKVKGVKVCVRGLDCNLSGGENLALKLYDETEDKALTCAFVFSVVAKTLSKITETLRETYPNIPVVYAGGVMGSRYIKSLLNFENIYFAKPELSSDNAVGVALLAYEKYRSEN